MNGCRLLWSTVGSLSVGMAIAAVACNLSGEADVTVTADIVVDAGLAEAESADAYPAHHARLPTVTTGGGPIVAVPSFIPVTFGSDPYESDIRIFTSGIGATAYWTTIASEYQVGAATSGNPIAIGAANEPPGLGATIDDGAIQTWLEAQIVSGSLAGTNGPSVIYALYFPTGTTVTYTPSFSLLTSCTGFGGYHATFSFTRPGDQEMTEQVAYVVIPRCPMVTPFAGNVVTGLDAITGPASHEYLEAATNPDGTGYGQTDPADGVWALTVGGEIGDLCLYSPGPYVNVPGFQYMVQRMWSNAASMRGDDPCIPAPAGEVFFGSVGELAATTLTTPSTTLHTTALSVPLGESRTVAVDLFSHAATLTRWNVRAVDTSRLTGGNGYLSFAWDDAGAAVASGQNGDKLYLTVTAKGLPPYGYDGVLLSSGIGAADGGVLGSSWMGLVIVR